jgi:glycerophosphoryl diester phosphodiesterase
MKKNIVWILTVLSIISINANCDGNKTPPTPPANTKPVASFSVSTTQTVVGTSVSFTNTSTDADNDIVSWSWDFADATPQETTSNASHSYALGGSYLVTLTVKDKANNVASASQRILVKNTTLPDYGSLGGGIRQRIANMFPGTMVCAHRAYHINYPENSLPAINDAIANKINIVEIDVRLTLDNEVAIMHDATTARTANGNFTIAQRTMAELKQLRLLHNGAPTTYQIPTLKECLLAAKGKVFVDIDASWDIAPFYYNKMYNEVAALNMVDMVFFYTESADVAKGLLSIDPDVTVLLGAGNTTDWNKANNLSPKPKLWHLASGTLSTGFTSAPFAEGIRFFANAYVNATTAPPLTGPDAAVDVLLNNKVSIIQTDHPVTVKNYLIAKGIWLQ